MTTPVWQAPQNGLPGDPTSTNSAGNLNQFLGAHGVTPVYDGVKIVASSGGTQLTWQPMDNFTDYAQPITMSGSTLGRVHLPLLPFGNGADVLVQLWPDNGSGAPNTSGSPLAATLVPAAYTNLVAAVEGLENATSPLMTPGDNLAGFTGSVSVAPYPAPAGNATGPISNPTICTSSDTVLFISGYDHAGATRLTTVASATYTNGTLAPPVPQPALPDTATFGGAAVVNNATVVVLGGYNTGNTLVANVWAASWDPGNHVVGSWSAQNALPQALYNCSTTSWNNTIYVVGGANASSAAVSTVYSASVTNGQLGAWQTSTFPIAVCNAFVVAVAGWLVVIGGLTTPGSTSGLQSVFYAKINADGSLGNWQTGPSTPNAEYAFASGWNVFAAGNAVVQISSHSGGSYAVQTLSVGPSGPGSFWYVSNWDNNGDLPFLAYPLGAGEWEVLSPTIAGSPSILQTSTLVPQPYVSVPLPASGLTNGATYHVLVRAFTASSASDGIQLGTLDFSPLPAVALQSARYTSAWSHIASGYSVPLRVYDASASGSLRHLVQDSVGGMAQSWSSLFWGQQKMLVGVADITMHPGGPLNSNPTFTSGVSPWTATNGTITQSSAQTHGGFAFSGLLTPAGGFSQSYALSELLPVTQTAWGGAQWVQANGWFNSPTGWSSFSLSVNWFDSGRNYISTSFANVSLTANTWTQVNNFFQPPATAAYGQLVPTESGTPGATNLLYLSNVTLTLTPETVGALTSAATVNYPANAYFPPTGVTQLL